jgi:hypothetical protein
VCQNQHSLLEVKDRTPGSELIWNLSGAPGAVILENYGNSILIDWGNPTGNKIVHLTERVGIGVNACSTAVSITVEVTAGSAPVPAEILHTPINNILIYNDSTVTCYRWGIIDANGSPSLLPGETFQAFVEGTDFDPNKKYFVQVWNGDCNNPDCSTIVQRSPVTIQGVEYKSALYPNPNFGEFTYEIYPVVEQGYILQIADPVGVIVEEREIHATANRIFETFSLQGRRDGVYYLSLWSADKAYGVIPFLKVSR